MLVRLRDALSLSMINGHIDQYRVSSLTKDNLRRTAGHVLSKYIALHPRSCVVGAHLDHSFSDFNRLSVRLTASGRFGTANLPFVVSFHSPTYELFSISQSYSL